MPDSTDSLGYTIDVYQETSLIKVLQGFSKF